MSIRLVQQFLKLESSSGIILLVMAIVSMIWANSSFAPLHEALKGEYLFFINDGLMAVFFLLMGLELKRGCIDGPLQSFKSVLLPGVAALGGMLVPALIYFCINWKSPSTIQGWTTPVATDIAFALGVLSLFGRRVPQGLKLFLLALAIFDDIGAIFIIAIWYSKGLSLIYAGLTLLLLGILWLFRQSAVRRLDVYLGIGLLLWFSVLLTGIHPTIAGVLLACLIPSDNNHALSPLHRLERILHPWVAYLIMPLFALANAGFALKSVSTNPLTSLVVTGIVLGLFLGKQIGVFGFTWLLVRFRFAALPAQTSWFQLYAVAILCGIGFTMSLFLGTLAFNQAFYLADVRMGVMLGSILSGLVGAIMLHLALNQSRRRVVAE